MLDSASPGWHGASDNQSINRIWDSPLKHVPRGGKTMANALATNRLRELFPSTWPDFDSMMEQFFGPQAVRGIQAYYVPASVWEDESSYHVEMDVPGVTRENVDLTYEKGTLRIT